MIELSKNELTQINGGKTIGEWGYEVGRKAYSWVKGFWYGLSNGKCPDQCSKS